eukprot:10685130-Lingulodinium_polyedra.AAC.1
MPSTSTYARAMHCLAVFATQLAPWGTPHPEAEHVSPASTSRQSGHHARASTPAITYAITQPSAGCVQ